MKKVLFLFVCLLALSCDDGDIVVTELDFDDQTLERCDAFDYLFFKINPMSNESIAFRFTTAEEILGDLGDVTIQLEGENTVVYRRFDDEVTSDYFCNPIPPTEPMVTDELLSTAGLATITTMGTLEDSDSIPSELEDPTGELDTDDDGLLDIYDEDDDGDNIPTILEGLGINPDDGTLNLALSRDTDEDGTPDYLDNDDDGDGILTINEDADSDLNPLNDDVDENNVTDYLDPSFPADGEALVTIAEYIEHSYRLVNVTVDIVINNIEFNDSSADETLNITDDLLNLGTFEAPDFPITETPDFN